MADSPPPASLPCTANVSSSPAFPRLAMNEQQKNSPHRGGLDLPCRAHAQRQEAEIPGTASPQGGHLRLPQGTGYSQSLDSKCHSAVWGFGCVALQPRENQTPFYVSPTERRWATGLNFLAEQGGGAFGLHTGNAIYELHCQPTPGGPRAGCLETSFRNEKQIKVGGQEQDSVPATVAGSSGRGRGTGSAPQVA